jgi:hypothetical protein
MGEDVDVFTAQDAFVSSRPAQAAASPREKLAEI